jgi:hypothetical protein
MVFSILELIAELSLLCPVALSKVTEISASNELSIDVILNVVGLNSEVHEFKRIRKTEKISMRFKEVEVRLNLGIKVLYRFEYNEL